MQRIFDKGKAEPTFPTESNYKTVVVGCPLGKMKTQLLCSFGEDVAYKENDYVPTVFDNHNESIFILDKEISLSLCDTSGQEENPRLMWHSLQGANIFIILVDYANAQSWQHADKWISGIKKDYPDATKVLVGIMEAEPGESRDKAKVICEKNQLDGFIECSLQDILSIQRVFNYAALKRVAVSPGGKEFIEQNPHAINCFLNPARIFVELLTTLIAERTQQNHNSLFKTLPLDVFILLLKYTAKSLNISLSQDEFLTIRNVLLNDRPANIERDSIEMSLTVLGENLIHIDRFEPKNAFNLSGLEAEPLNRASKGKKI